MITKQQLDKWIDLEINWLRYYGYRADRENLTQNSNIYNDINSIGYTKRVIPLIRRCSPATITSDEIITSTTNLKDMYEVYSYDRDNKYSPLEIYWMIYPEKRFEIIKLLQ